MKKIYFSEIKGNSLGYLALVAGLGLFVALLFFLCYFLILYYLDLFD
jgi:hypothetical protein